MTTQRQSFKTYVKRHYVVLFLLILVGSCGPSQEFTAVPEAIHLQSTPRDTIDITAEHFHFTPEEVRIKQGTLVTLHIRSIDGTHGFKLGAFGIDVNVYEDSTTSTQFYAAKKGEYGFRCSHFCGVGHFGMTGKVMIEE